MAHIRAILRVSDTPGYLVHGRYWQTPHNG